MAAAGLTHLFCAYLLIAAKFVRKRPLALFRLTLPPHPPPPTVAQIRKIVNNCGQCKLFVYNSKQLFTKGAEM